jgi:hypothetical protein
MIMRTALAAALLLLGTAGGAFAQQNCAQQLDDLTNEWNAIGFVNPRQNAQIVRGSAGHVHTGAQVQYMKTQMTMAGHLCKKGEEHESMLRMDVVRAWLKLPEVQHPPEHGYTGSTKN